MDQKEWLMYLNRTALPTDKSIQVCEKVNWKRMSLNEVGNRPINHRVILPNEVVIETDRSSYEENRQFARIIATALCDLNIPFTMAFSGNKSFHFHVFTIWDVLISEKRSQTLKEKGFTFNDAKEKVIIRLFDFLTKLEKITFGNSYLDYRNLYKNKLIREFGGQHEKTSYYKTYLAELPKEKLEVRNFADVRYPERIRLWNCKEDLKIAIQSWKPRERKYKQVFSP